MKKDKFMKLITLPLVILLVTLTGLLACTASPAEMPDITISSLTKGAELKEGNITISVEVSNFDIVSKLGDAAESGEGHIHYYMDAEPPTTQGQPAVTGQGTYAAVADTSYTWTGVGPGMHTFAVQLVNNDHTPLDPPVTDEITVNIVASITQEESRQTAEEFVKNSPTFVYDGMEDTMELIDTRQGDSATSWIFTFTFDSSHAGYGDRTGMVLAQVITPHEAVITVEDGEVTRAMLDDVWDMMTQEMMTAMPEVMIVTTAVSGDEITVTVAVSNFNLVSKLGEAAAPGEGHLHFYLDTTIPTTPDQPAVSAPGTYAVTTGTSYTWKGVAAGDHTLGVQLVNNNHTPLQPTVTDTVQVTVEENLFSLVSGWYMGREVQYYDFGANTPLDNGGVLTAPIYALVTGMDNDGNPQFVSGQHNIIDVIPGDSGYSDLWQVYLVTVSEDYEADSIRSVSELMAENFTITQTDILVNCPVVPANSVLETGGGLTQGWYKGEAIYYFDFGPNPDIAAPIYALITGMDAQGNPQFVEGQLNIIDVVPGDEGYSAFWRVNLVTVPQEYMANTFKLAADVMASGYDMTETDILVNCPVVNVSNAAESVSIELSADNTAFDKSTITVPAGAMVTITFDNMDNVPHNFALYETSAATASIFVGEIINGSETIDYTFTAPATPGTYFFRCDVHPAIMTGDFIVE